jgi:hypothetical protein
VLRYMYQKKACEDGGTCRVNCYFGHFCLVEACSMGCQFELDDHGVDQDIHHWDLGTLSYRNRI